jgi:hypothetical protein
MPWSVMRFADNVEGLALPISSGGQIRFAASIGPQPQAMNYNHQYQIVLLGV